MSGLETKVAENGGPAAEAAPSADGASALKVEPSAETISAAEALKMEGNALLAGECVCGWVGVCCAEYILSCV